MRAGRVVLSGLLCFWFLGWWVRVVLVQLPGVVFFCFGGWVGVTGGCGGVRVVKEGGRRGIYLSKYHTHTQTIYYLCTYDSVRRT
jgi:hypothetical protein